MCAVCFSKTSLSACKKALQFSLSHSQWLPTGHGGSRGSSNSHNAGNVLLVLGSSGGGDGSHRGRRVCGVSAHGGGLRR